MYRLALATAERRDGLKHPATAAAAHDLAECLRYADKRAAAEPLHRRALAIRDARLAPTDPRLATSLVHLGDLLRTLGRSDRAKYAEAETCLRRAVAIRETHYGPTHREVAVALHGLARALRAAGRAVDAEPHALRCMTIVERQLGRDHPYAWGARRALQALLREQGKTAVLDDDYAAPSTRAVERPRPARAACRDRPLAVL